MPSSRTGDRGVDAIPGFGPCWWGVFGGGIAAGCVAVVRSRARRERAELREHTRASRAHLAAVEAGEDDPRFSPHAIEQEISSVVTLADELWQNDRFDPLHDRPDGDVIGTWARSLESRIGNGLEVVGRPSVDVLQIKMLRRIASSLACACASTARTTLPES